MERTIKTVRRYINGVEVSREELLSHRVYSPVLNLLYQTAVRRIEAQRKEGTVRKSS